MVSDSNEILRKKRLEFQNKLELQRMRMQELQGKVVERSPGSSRRLRRKSEEVSTNATSSDRIRAKSVEIRRMNQKSREITEDVADSSGRFPKVDE